MSRNIYRVTLTDDQAFLMAFDPTRPEVGVSCNWSINDSYDPDRWDSTQYQSANFAGGGYLDERAAAQAIARDYAEGDDDCTEIDTIVVLKGSDLNKYREPCRA